MNNEQILGSMLVLRILWPLKSNDLFHLIHGYTHRRQSSDISLMQSRPWMQCIWYPMNSAGLKMSNGQHGFHEWSYWTETLQFSDKQWCTIDFNHAQSLNYWLSLCIKNLSERHCLFLCSTITLFKENY